MDLEKMKKIASRFRKRFPEFKEATDDECFAFACYIRDCKRKQLRKFKNQLRGEFF